MFSNTNTDHNGHSGNRTVQSWPQDQGFEIFQDWSSALSDGGPAG